MVTRAADYALRATLVLAALPSGSRICLTDLAAECEVSPAFLYKVLGQLARAGLLVPHRGVSGGYELTEQARSGSVLDVVEAVNGLPPVNICVISGDCHRSPGCPAHPVWVEAQQRVREVLVDARIADLAARQAADRPAQTTLRVRQAAADRPVREPAGKDSGTRRPAHAGRRAHGSNRKRMEDR